MRINPSVDLSVYRNIFLVENFIFVWISFLGLDYLSSMSIVSFISSRE